MNDIDRSILATLAYYGAFGWPLIPMEIYARLIPARRVGGRTTEVSLGMVLERLEILAKLGRVQSEYGFYMLDTADAGFGERRIEAEKVWAQKWKRMLRRAWWFQAVPYVRALCASGSLALGNMNAASDWDVFVIAQKGRLYTARMGLVAVAWCLGALRTKRMTKAPDRFCFNHYVATDGLALRHRSLYVGQGLALMVPMLDRHHYLERLWQANGWMGDGVASTAGTQYVRRSVQSSWLLKGVAVALELLLDTPVGTGLERTLRWWQRRRIAATPATHERGGRIVYDDRELEFHPRSFEAVALSFYNDTLERMGLGAHVEHDSGLTR